MLKSVVTGFSQEEWDIWGVSFLASLKDQANFIGQIIFVCEDFFSKLTKNKLQELGIVLLLPNNEILDPRMRIWLTLSDYVKQNPGLYIYWDSDVYFQAPITPLLALQTSFISSQGHPGLLGGLDAFWGQLGVFIKVASFIEPDMTASLFLDKFIRYIGPLEKVDNTWNFSGLPILKEKDGQLTYKGEVVNIIHPVGSLKYSLAIRPMLYPERQPSSYKHWRSLLTNGISLRAL